jgi:lipooligosaccharide transport system ATP-binding protein
VVELRYASPEAQEAAFAALPTLVTGNGGNGRNGSDGESGAERIEALPDRLLIYTDSGDAVAARLPEVGVEGDGAAPTAVLVRRSSLEDVFLRLTGRSLED